MTFSIGLAAAFVNVVVLMMLAAASVSPRVSQVARLVIAILAFAFAWLTTVAFYATRSPDWTTLIAGAVIVVSMRWTATPLARCSAPWRRRE